MKKLIQSLVFLLLISCVEKNENKVLSKKFGLDSFPVETSIQGEKIFIESVLNPNKILLKDGFLVVSEEGFGNLLHIIKQDGLLYQSSIGKQGQGPGEIKTGIWELDRGINKGNFWAYDLQAKTFYEYSLEDTSSTAKRSIQQNEAWFLGYSMHWIDSNKIISYVSRDSFKFGIFDTLGNRISSLGPWSLEKEVDESMGYALMGLYQGPIEYNFKSKILVFASSKFESFQIFNLKTGQVISLTGPGNIKLEYEINTDGNAPFAILNPDIPRGYIDVFVGEKSIFLAHIGKTYQEVQEMGELSRSIFQFDFQGNPLAYFQLNFPIKSIAVDEFSRKIYTVTDDKDPRIAVFNY